MPAEKQEPTIDEKIRHLESQIVELHVVVAGLTGRVDLHASWSSNLAGRVAMVETRLATLLSVVNGKVDGLREEIAGLTRWLL